MQFSNATLPRILVYTQAVLAILWMVFRLLTFRIGECFESMYGGFSSYKTFEYAETFVVFIGYLLFFYVFSRFLKVYSIIIYQVLVLFFIVIRILLYFNCD